MRHIFYILVFILLCIGCSKTPNAKESENATFKLLTAEQKYTAGVPIQFRFEYDQTSDVSLLLRNAYGTTLIKPIIEGGILTFDIPPNFVKNAGVCRWVLHAFQKRYTSGEFEIIPDTKNNVEIETYLGPRNITAGAIDYTMMIVVPTDRFDNPLPANTEVTITHQFQNGIEENVVQTKNLLAWRNIGAPEKSGRLLIAASCNATVSKELTSIVFPANATDFTIDFERNHAYADGNQIMTFSTSILKDKYGNIISDGTLVTFIIRNSLGMLLKTQGTSLNGIASAEFLHPYEKDSWTVTGYITGAAKSTDLIIDFEASINDYALLFSDDNRTIHVGPIKSFMNQLVPDGMPIKLRILDAKENVLETRVTTSRNGEVEFKVSSDFFSNGNYSYETEVAGILKVKKVMLK